MLSVLETVALSPFRRRVTTWKPGGPGRPPLSDEEARASYQRQLQRQRKTDPAKSWAFTEKLSEAERKRRAADKNRKWAAENREHVNAKRREARQNNPERFKRAYGRRQQNETQRLSAAIRSRIRNAFATLHPTFGSDKNGRPWESLVGYTVDDLKAHIERQFKGRMSWVNFGKWHVDHIVPVASFSFASVDDPEFRACWALTNLRPLWSRQNRAKHAKRTLLL